MGGKKPLRRPLWPPTRETASNYYPLGLDGAGGAAKPLLRAPKKPAPLHGRLPAFSGAVDAFERARKCFLEWRYFFSIILSEFLKNRVALHRPHKNANTVLTRTKSRDTMQAGKALIGKSKCSRFFCSECGLMEAAQRMSPERTPVSFPLNLLRAVSRGRRQPLVIAAVLSTGRVHKSDWCVRAPVI